MPQTRFFVFLPLALLVVACSIYFVFPSEQHYLDDPVNLAPLEILEQDPGRLGYLVTNNESGLLGRSVAMMSFGVEVIFNGFSYRGFKITNAVIHLFNIFLVLLVCREVLLARGHTTQVLTIAFCVAVFWAVMPVHVSSVMYPVQRMTLLSALFVLLGVYFYLRGRRAINDNREGVLAASGLFGLSLVVCLPLAVFSKENGILLVPILFLFEAALFRFSRDGKPLLGLIAGYAGLALAGAVLCVWFWEDITGYINADYRGRTPLEGLMTQARILCDYIAALLIPSNIGFGYFHDDYLVSRGLLAPSSTLAAVGFVLSAIMLSAVFAFLKRSLVAVGILLFFTAHLLESSILPLELYFEHRNYLPSVGIALAVVWGGYRLWKFTETKSLVPAAFIIYLSVNVYVLSVRAELWNDAELGVVISEQYHPESVRTLSAFSGYQAGQGFYFAAINSLDRIKALKPELAASVELQKMYVACTSYMPLENTTITFFSGDQRLGSPSFFTGVLQRLSEASNNKQCMTQEQGTHRLLFDWSQRTRVDKSIRIRLAEFFLSQGEIGLAIDSLREAWRRNMNDVQSSLLLFELLLSEQAYGEARMMAIRLENMVDSSGVASWRETFEEANNYLERQAAPE